MQPIKKHVEDVRRFNRFYTRRIGLLNSGFLESRFSLSEVRVLYEIAYRKSARARDIAADLKLDAGYLSRILRSFERAELVRRTPSAADQRELEISLTPQGLIQFRRLERRQRHEVRQLLEPLSVSKQNELVSTIRQVQVLLDAQSAPAL